MKNEASKKKKSNFILIALLATIFIWFLLGSLFICHRIKAMSCKDKKCRNKPETKASITSSSSKPSSKISKISSKLFTFSGDSKKPSNTSSGTTGRSKKTSSSSGRASQSTTSNKGSRSSLASGSASPAPSSSSKHSIRSLHSERSASSQSSRPPEESKASPTGSDDSQQSKNSKKTSTKKSSKGSSCLSSLLLVPGEGSKTQKPMYPASCACHTSMTGKYRMTSSSEEQIRRKEKEEPLVFGYELDTSSDSSPRGQNEEVVLDFGELSK